MIDPIIYHGTPMTPRAALDAVMPGRAGCVSFYRPQDLEALLAICPQLMFRSRGFLVLDGSDARRTGVGPGKPRRMVAGILCLAGAYHLPSRSLRADTGQPRSANAGQRRAPERLALRVAGRSGLSHGRARLSTTEALREVPESCDGMDWASETRASRMRSLPSQDGRDRRRNGERVASSAHAARHRCCVGLPLFERGCDHAGAERVAV